MQAPDSGYTAYQPMGGQQQPQQQLLPTTPTDGGSNGPNKSLLCLAFFSLVALVFYAAAEGNPEWAKAEATESGVDIKERFGLWKVCVEASYMGQSQSSCQTWDDLLQGHDPDHWELFKSVRGFSIVAILLGFAHCVSLGLAGWRDDWKVARLSFSIGLLTALAALLAIIQFARFKNYADDDINASGGTAPNLEFGASFVLEILGLILSLFSGAGVFVAGRMANTQ